MLEIIVAAATVSTPVLGAFWYLSGRLSKIEQGVGEVNRIIKRELTMNGGSSVKDTVIRLDERINGPLRHRWDEPEGTEF